VDADGRRDWFVRLLVVTFLNQALLAAVRPMVSYRAVALGAGALELGIVGAGFGFASLLLAIPLGRWTDRWGTFPVLAAGVALNTVSTASLLWIDSIAGLVVSQVLLGVGQLCVALASQTLVGGGRSRLSSDARFGAFTAVISIAQFVTPSGAGLLAGSDFSRHLMGADDAYGTSGVFLVSSAFGLVSLSLVLSLAHWTRRGPAGARAGRPPRRSRSAERAGRIPIRQVLGIEGMPQALVASALVFTSIDVITVYLPAYGEESGLSIEVVTLLLTARAGGSIAGRVLLIPLIALIGRRWTLILSVLVPAAALATFPLVHSEIVLFALAAVAGAGLGIGQPVTLAWAVQRTPPAAHGTAVALRIAAMRLSQGAIPPAVGAIAVGAGLGIVFPILSATLLVVAVTVATASFRGEDPESVEPVDDGVV
jgi:MFS family permease